MAGFFVALIAVASASSADPPVHPVQRTTHLHASLETSGLTTKTATASSSCAAGGHPVRKTRGPGAAYCTKPLICVPEERISSCPKAGPAVPQIGHGHPGFHGLH